MSTEAAPPFTARRHQMREARILVVLCSDQATRPVVNTGTTDQ